MDFIHFFINIRNIRIFVYYLFVVYLSKLLIRSGYISTKCRVASGDEFKTWNQMRLWSNMRCYVGVNLTELRKPLSYFTS